MAQGVSTLDTGLSELHLLEEIITSRFFRTCGDQVQYSFGIMFTDAVLDYQLEHGEDRVLKQLVAEP